MVRTDNSVKKYLGPESQYPEAIGINGFVELLRNEVIQQSKCKECKPHAHAGVHIVTLDDRLSQSVLPERKVSSERDDDGKDDG